MGALLLDVGNRRVKAALWSREDGMGRVARVEPARGAEGADTGWVDILAERLGIAWPYRGAIHLASTRPEFDAALGGLAGGSTVWRRVAEPDWPCPVRSAGTGADRVLGAWAAWRRVRAAGGAAPVVVADCGSAWTLDCMDAAGTFLGGAIGPGLGAQEEALAAATPHLPAPAREGPAGVPASSAAALEAGTRGALAEALRGLSRRWTEQLGAMPRRFLAGGDAAALLPWLGEEWEPAPDLVLEGLAELAAREDLPGA